MDFKVSVKKEKSEAFIRLMQNLEDLQVIEKFQAMHVLDQFELAEAAENHQQWSHELTSDLAAAEFVNRYRDLVD